MPFLYSRKEMTKVIYACSCQSLPFFPMAENCPCFPCLFLSPEPDGCGEDSYILDCHQSQRVTQHLCGTDGSIRRNGWDFVVVTVHSTEEENILWSQQASLLLGLPIPAGSVSIEGVNSKTINALQSLHFSSDFRRLSSDSLQCRISLLSD